MYKKKLVLIFCQQYFQEIQKNIIIYKLIVICRSSIEAQPKTGSWGRNDGKKKSNNEESKAERRGTPANSMNQDLRVD